MSLFVQRLDDAGVLAEAEAVWDGNVEVAPVPVDEVVAQARLAHSSRRER